MITRFFKKIYKFIDKFIVVPISRAIYYLSKKFKKNQGKLDKILNRPNFLIYLSLIIAVGLFLLIDSKVISLVETEAEVITNVPVVVNYNEEAYVVEGVPETVDITITGRKSDIYLAKQLGEYEVILDLSDYKPGDTPYKVYFTYSKSIDSLSYQLSPEYVQVTIKNKESQVKSIDYDLLNIDALDSRLSVESVTLNQSEVVVKGGSDALDAIASVKALIDLEEQEFTEAGTYDIDNIALVAYDSNGNRLDNVEIVPNTISATIVLDSYSKTVPLTVQTTGDLVTGKAIASILINNNSSYSITIYGDEAELENIESIPVTIDVSGMGNESTRTYRVNIRRPNGVRDMSTDSVEITATFGDEEQKTITLTSNFAQRNIANGLTANPIAGQEISVQVKGVASVIENINAEDIQAYIDLEGLGAGDHEVEVQIDNTNPLVSYVVSNTLRIRITEN
ncbi:MAG TPA: hypothetical protein IAB65_01480 [Candidatus Onthocola stercorigallinarum]|nr:hypothetical protein [Candidatus Onthocola stercorigallinarum]